ncbi:MAG: hypothetical protein K6G45_05370 [Lachnospiraceae bacterium]|nr:hypothetical protein [Lachnospiraceae bacterium]
MKAKKSLVNSIMVMVILIAVLVFTGCSGGSKDNNTTTGTPAPTEAAANTQAPTATAEPTKAVTTPEPTAEPTTEPAVTPEPTQAVSAQPEHLLIYIGNEFDSEWNDEQNMSNGWYEYDYPIIDPDQAVDYPRLSEAFDKYKGYKESITQDILDDISSAAISDEHYGEYFRNEYMSVLRADSNLVSIQYNYSIFTGGIHGQWGTFGICWDPVTGQPIELKDIIKDKDAFVKTAYDELMTKYTPDDFFENDMKSYISHCLENDVLSFEIGYDYLSVIFNPDEVYYSQIYVDIPFKGNETLFNEKYLAVPSDYMVNFNKTLEFRADFNHDGTVDKVDIYRDLVDEYENFSGFTYYLNDQPIPKNFDFEYTCYEMEPVYIHANGKDYIYITTWFDSDDTETYAYRIDMNENGYDENAEDNPYGTIVEIDHGTLWDFASNGSYDPMNMAMKCRRDMIGTNFIKADYRVGSDGLPELISDAYYFTYGYELTTLQELEMKEVSWDDYEVTGDVTVAVGEKLTMYRTDGRTYVDFMRNVNGLDTVVRLEMTEKRIDFDDGDYYITYGIKGFENAYEVFDGIGYAD